MSKKLKNLKWESVALEGFPASLKDDFQGFVGLEECTDYGLDTDNKKPKKKKQQKEIKRKQTDVPVDLEVPKKKVKLSNGFIVEPCNPTSPSLNNEIAEEKINKNNISKKKKHKTEKDKKQNDKGTSNSENAKNNGANSKSNRKAKLKLGEVALDSKSNLTPEDMLTWAEFKLPEPIMRALTEMGFQRPTKIQQLTLPAAIHGRRDILGAAETGSGKTLAFGLPILSGILKLKEKASAGVNVYDLPYKKPSKKQKPVIVDSKRRKNIDKRRGRQDVKESSEDGYESGDDEKSDGDKNDDSNTVSDEELNNKQENTSDADETSDKESFIEEIEVPVKKAVNSVDEGNDSDSDNYTHLSDLLDSADDVSSDEEKADESEAADDHDKGGETVDSEHQNSDGSETDDASEEFLDENGIGCVKVIDNVELPGHVVTRTGKPLYALILTPTRELAIQISRHLIAVAKYTGIRIATIIGGMATVKQDRVLRCGPEVVVATPGRLWEMLGRHPHLQQIDTIKFLAIDETDRMVERGHFEELKTLLERINTDPEKAATRQNFVFSATLTMVHDLPIHMKGKKVTNRGKIINRKISKMTPQQKIDKFIKMFGMTEPKVVDITQQNFGTADTLTESIISCAIEHKDSYLYYILKRHPGRTIVFCNSIGSVKRLAQLFTILKCNPLPLHASMPQRQRIKNLERFRDDPHGVLVATDVAARGLDIPDVDHVVHYQVPRTAENYVHRSGRTARASKEGLTILMVEPAEAYLYTKMCRTLNKTSELPPFPIEPQVLPTLREIVSLGREIDVLMLKRRRVTQALGWREKAAKEMDMILDNDDVPCKEMDPTIDKALQVKKRRLDTLISRPVYPRGFSFKYPTLNDPLALVEKDENALEVMKNSLKSGAIKKEKRKSKNAPLLKLHKKLDNK